MTEGTKHDKGKLAYALLAPDIRNEIEVTALQTRVKVGPGSLEHIRSLLDSRMYIQACVNAMAVGDVSLHDIIYIYTRGAEKYNAHNWRAVRPVDRYISAAYRHLKHGINEEDFGCPHLAHFCWNMTVLRWFEKKGIIPETFQ